MTLLSINIVGEQIAVEGLISPSKANGRFKIKLPETLIESLTLEEFRWYIEDYARKDPFALERARSAKLSLDSYGSSLADAVCCSDDVCADLLDSDLVILLNVGEDCPLEISRIHWELLENLDFWTRVRPRKVSVLRIVTSKKPNNATLRSPHLSQERLRQQRILAVSARSNQKDDIPHRLITRPILDVVREKQYQTIAPPTLEIVRPGTFAALVAVLESHDVGYFDVVHFDVHGFVSREGAFLKFLKPGEDMVDVHEVPLPDIARILGRRGVGIVILNACQSASEQGPLANIAKSIVQNGVDIAIGMRYEILDTAAEIFTKTLYRQLLGHGQSWWEAASTARLAMRLDQQRSTEFNNHVDIQDYITPVIFSRRAPSTGEVAAMDVPELHNLSLATEDAEEILGREADILSMETKLAASNILLVRGSPGSGKTHLSRHLAWWWKATGFIERYGIIDSTQIPIFNVVSLQSAIASALVIKTFEESSTDVTSYLNTNRCLIIIDSLDTSHFDDRAEPGTKLEIRRFLRRIKKSFVILFSRRDEDWVKAAAKVTFYLKHLAMKPSLQLATKEISRHGCETSIDEITGLRSLEQCILLVDGNPLAIKLLMGAHSLLRIPMLEFYHKLTDGSCLDFPPDFVEGDQARALGDAQNLIRMYLLSGSMLPTHKVDLRLLAPFWRTFPLDINAYRVFFDWAVRRIVNASTEIIKSSDPHLEIKLAIERFTLDEKGILLLKRAIPDREFSLLDSLDEVLAACEKEGYLTRTFVTILEQAEEHVRIHPLMTLALRQAQWALPGLAKHAVQISYYRFWVYRSRYWPTTGMGTSAWEGPRHQLDYNFANYLTASNFSLRITADPDNVPMLVLPFKTAHGVSGNPRRMLVVFDLLERLLETFGTQLAQHSGLLPSTCQAVLRGEIKLNAEQRERLSDARGMLEMVCLLAIQSAINYADVLSMVRDYSPLLERIAANFLPESGYKDVNLPILRVIRIQFEHIKKRSRDNVKAMADALGLSEARRTELAQFRETGPLKFLTSFSYETLKEVEAAESSEEISRIEQKLHDLLRKQLDGVESDRFKELIYESLSVLARKRKNYPLALDHLDRAIGFGKRLTSADSKGLQSLRNLRLQLLEEQGAK